MNAHPVFAADTLRSAGRETSALKAWRKRQMVEDAAAKGRRTMRITDVPERYGIAVSTWHAWEQLPGTPDFRCPNAENMNRLCGEITKGAVTPADFYPPMAMPRSASGAG